MSMEQPSEVLARYMASTLELCRANAGFGESDASVHGIPEQGFGLSLLWSEIANATMRSCSGSVRGVANVMPLQR